MPELPEVETVRRELEPAMVGEQFVEVALRRANLRRPFGRGFARRLVGTHVLALTRRGKFLLAELSSRDTLVMHLGMSGAFRIDRRPGDAGDGNRARLAHDHVVLTMSSGAVITYNDPRRFGSMELVREREMPTYAPLRGLGPEPLSPNFNGAALARACAGKTTPIKAALLDQHVVAGVGNIYASEALHRAGISPRRRAASIATAAAGARGEAPRLAAAIRSVLTQAITRHAAAYRSSRFRVYDRDGARCVRSGCDGTIIRITQAGRSTFYCPSCQK